MRKGQRAVYRASAGLMVITAAAPFFFLFDSILGIRTISAFPPFYILSTIVILFAPFVPPLFLAGHIAVSFWMRQKPSWFAVIVCTIFIAASTVILIVVPPFAGEGQIQRGALDGWLDKLL